MRNGFKVGTLIDNAHAVFQDECKGECRDGTSVGGKHAPGTTLLCV
jgi:hypothetical protein